MTANYGIVNGLTRPEVTLLPGYPTIPVAPGRWFLPSSQVGAAGYASTTIFGTTSASNGYGYGFPVVFREPMTIDAMALHVTGANDGANAAVRLGVYTDVDGVLMNPIIDAGSSSINATGMKTLTFAPRTVPVGWYWVVCVLQNLNTSGSNPQLSLSTTSQIQTYWIDTPPASNNMYGSVMVQSQGGLPVWPYQQRPDYNARGQANIWMRRSSR